MEIYAWVLMPNHFHNLLRAGLVKDLKELNRNPWSVTRRLSVNLRGDGGTQSTCCLFSVAPTIQERIIRDTLEKVLIRAAGRNWSADTR
ncbi:MAG: hypothetical protein SRB2_03840 [Desulfobacteraceae bacterium Eth-SRB2]|nr:MAG: hypothetical protein SRB2_03840 [Desulfobacteraceae bacterium Eth-SRB2]